MLMYISLRCIIVPLRIISLCFTYWVPSLLIWYLKSKIFETNNWYLFTRNTRYFGRKSALLKEMHIWQTFFPNEWL